MFLASAFSSLNVSEEEAVRHLVDGFIFYLQNYFLLKIMKMAATKTARPIDAKKQRQKSLCFFLYKVI